jgi:hypothetical protein
MSQSSSFIDPNLARLVQDAVLANSSREVMGSEGSHKSLSDTHNQGGRSSAIVITFFSYRCRHFEVTMARTITKPLAKKPLPTEKWEWTRSGPVVLHHSMPVLHP